MTNKLEINGETLVERAIRESLSSSVLKTIVVSTDDPDIQQLAVATGAEAPFVRPDELSHDTASMVDVVLHAVNFFRSVGSRYSHIVLLQPTSPFRKANHIDEAVRLFLESGATSVVSVCRQSHPWKWSFSLASDKRLQHAFPDFEAGQRSQDAEYLFFPNGSIYVISTDSLEDRKTFFPETGLVGFEMSKLESTDIDDERDYTFARTIAEAMGNGV